MEQRKKLNILDGQYQQPTNKLLLYVATKIQQQRTFSRDGDMNRCIASLPGKEGGLSVAGHVYV